LFRIIQLDKLAWLTCGMMILVCYRDPIPLNMINLYKILDLIREEILEYDSHSVIIVSLIPRVLNDTHMSSISLFVTMRKINK
jgi:hypothetical protein